MSNHDWMSRCCRMATLGIFIFAAQTEAQSQCERSMRTGGSVLKGKTYEVHADFAGVSLQQALDRLTAGLPSREIEVTAVDGERGLIVGRTNSAGQRPYPVELQVSSSPSGSSGRLLLSLPFGAFATAGMASQLCDMLSLIAVPTESEAAPLVTPVTEANSAEPQPTVAGCPNADQLISKKGAGGVFLGMTVAEVRKALPRATIARTMDGDGMVLIEAKVGEETVMILYAGEEDYESPPRDSAVVEAIWIYSDRYATSEGVCPGMLLSEAAKLLGGTPELMISEIESREYATFPDQYQGFEFRTGGGIYPAGNRSSRQYEPTATVWSILVH